MGEESLSVRLQKQEKKRLYDLGYYEDDDYRWRCAGCHELRQFVQCSCANCGGGCEWCKGGKKS